LRLSISNRNIKDGKKKQRENKEIQEKEINNDKKRKFENISDNQNWKVVNKFDNIQRDQKYYDTLNKKNEPLKKKPSFKKFKKI
jgi:hypothetical protein